ncbi:hypothetical protein FIV42_10440 [Persicimonas caeni]|uniref:Uncharacterized protein n=1 Tax=Persicimonas caeni TaxID=2292766 RepID=A0A4Y6PS40_PERCE|nr:hypothetical protein [Persicimonas caeni]QDG51138.1 hypothetical protein FIV42_10440 [Persicimonas caeni]QED32359.1 hypothetical protein FRD00_10435 [Persicimonas caeni]
MIDKDGLDVDVAPTDENGRPHVEVNQLAVEQAFVISTIGPYLPADFEHRADLEALVDEMITAWMDASITLAKLELLARSPAVVGQVFEIDQGCLRRQLERAGRPLSRETADEAEDLLRALAERRRLRAKYLEAQAELVENGGRLVRRVETLYRNTVGARLAAINGFYEALTSTKYYDIPASGSPRLRLEMLPIETGDWQGKQTRVSARVSLVTQNTSQVTYEGVQANGTAGSGSPRLEATHPLGLVVHEVAFSCAEGTSKSCTLKLDRLPKLGFRPRFERNPAQLRRLAAALGLPPQLGVSIAGVDITEQIHGSQLTWKAHAKVRIPRLSGEAEELTLVLFEHGELQPLEQVRSAIQRRVRKVLQTDFCSDLGRQVLSKQIGVQIGDCSAVQLTQQGLKAVVTIRWKLPDSSHTVEVSGTLRIRNNDGEIQADIIEGSIDADALRTALRDELEDHVAALVAALPAETLAEINRLVGVATAEHRAALITDALAFEASGRLTPPRVCAQGKLREADIGWGFCVTPEGKVTWSTLPDVEALLAAIRRLFDPEALLVRSIAHQSCAALEDTTLFGDSLAIISASSSDSAKEAGTPTCRFTAKVANTRTALDGTQVRGAVSWTDGRVRWKTLRLEARNLEEFLDKLVRARLDQFPAKLPFELRDVRIDRGMLAFHVYIDVSELAQAFNAGEVRIDFVNGQIEHQGSLSDLTFSLLAGQLQAALNHHLGGTSLELGDVRIELAAEPVSLSINARDEFTLSVTGDVDFDGVLRVPVELQLLPHIEIANRDHLVQTVLRRLLVGNLANLGLGFLAGADPPIKVVDITPAPDLRHIEIEFDLEFPVWKFKVDLDGLILSTAGLEFPAEIGARIPGYIPAGPFYLARPGFSYNRLTDKFSILTDIIFSPGTEHIAKIDARLTAGYEAVAFALRGTLRLLGVIPLYEVRGDVDFETGRMELVSESVGFIRKLVQSDSKLIVDGYEQTFSQTTSLGVLGLSLTQTELVGAIREGMLKAIDDVNLLVGHANLRVHAKLDSLREWLGAGKIELMYGLKGGGLELSAHAVVLELTAFGVDITIRVPTLSALTPAVLLDAIDQIFDVGSLWDAIKNFDGDIVVDLVGGASGDGEVSARVGEGNATVEASGVTRHPLVERAEGQTSESNEQDSSDYGQRPGPGPSPQPRPVDADDEPPSPFEDSAPVADEGDETDETTEGQPGEDLGFSKEGVPVVLREIPGNDGVHLCQSDSEYCRYYLPPKAAQSLGGAGSHARILADFGVWSPFPNNRICFGQTCLHFELPGAANPVYRRWARPQIDSQGRPHPVFQEPFARALVLLSSKALIVHPTHRPLGYYPNGKFEWFPSGVDKTAGDLTRSVFAAKVGTRTRRKGAAQRRWNSEDSALAVLENWVRDLELTEWHPRHQVMLEVTCASQPTGDALLFLRAKRSPETIRYAIRSAQEFRHIDTVEQKCLKKDALTDGCGRSLVRLWMQTFQYCGDETQPLQMREEILEESLSKPRRYTIGDLEGEEVFARFDHDEGRKADARFLEMATTTIDLHYEGIFNSTIRNPASLYDHLVANGSIGNAEIDLINHSVRTVLKGLPAPRFGRVAACSAKGSGSGPCKYSYAHSRPGITLSKSTPQDSQTGTHRTYRVKEGHVEYDLEVDSTTFRLFGGQRLEDAQGNINDRMDHTRLSGPTRFEAILRFMFSERQRSAHFPQLLWVGPDNSVYFTTNPRSTDKGQTPAMLHIFQPGESTPRRVELVAPFPGHILPGSATPPTSESTSTKSLQPLWTRDSVPKALRRVHGKLVRGLSTDSELPRLSLASMGAEEPTAWLRQNNQMMFVPPEGTIVTTKLALLEKNWATAAKCGLFKPELLRRYRARLDARPQKYKDTPTSRWTDAAIPLLIELVSLSRWRDSMQVHPSFLLAEHHRQNLVCIGNGDN